jgi:hypothetical protein
VTCPRSPLFTSTFPSRLRRALAGLIGRGRQVGSRSMDRRLTALLYLNLRWVPEHGGCVRLYEQDGGGQTAPLQDDGVVAAQIEPVAPRPRVLKSPSSCGRAWHARHCVRCEQ